MRLLGLEDYKQDVGGHARVFGNLFRTKTYLKDFPALCRLHPRDWPFMGVPPLSAAARLGCSPNFCNETLILNLAECNLHCWFCFAASMLDEAVGKNWSLSEQQIWSAMELYATVGRYRVLRISGGEPLLQQGSIVRMLDDFKNHATLVKMPPYIWFDTNLTIAPEEELVAALKAHPGGVGVSGCFKGWTDQDVMVNTGQEAMGLGEQMRTARDWVETGLDVYFYVVDSTDIEIRRIGYTEIARGFIGELRDFCGDLAPLKCGVMPIHEGYKCATRGKSAGTVTNEMQWAWGAALLDYYEPRHLWIPPHLITPIMVAEGMGAL